MASTSVTDGDNGPNALGPNDGDSFPQCSQVIAAMGMGAAGMQSLRMPCNPNAANSPHWQQTIRSDHPDGANIGMCDGSVRFLRDDIQIRPTTLNDLKTNRSNPATYNLNELSVWDRLILANDHEAVSAADF